MMPRQRHGGGEAGGPGPSRLWNGVEYTGGLAGRGRGRERRRRFLRGQRSGALVWATVPTAASLYRTSSPPPARASPDREMANRLRGRRVDIAAGGYEEASTVRELAVDRELHRRPAV